MRGAPGAFPERETLDRVRLLAGRCLQVPAHRDKTMHQEYANEETDSCAQKDHDLPRMPGDACRPIARDEAVCSLYQQSHVWLVLAWATSWDRSVRIQWRWPHAPFASLRFNVPCPGQCRSLYRLSEGA